MPSVESRPRRALPPGAWDCHTHVFGPYARFPLAAERSYTPPEATFEAHLAMLDSVGLAHCVLVHPSAYGLDHAALFDALERAGGRLRGTAVATAETPDRELADMNRRGVRALRFVETGGAGGQRFVGAVGLEEFPRLAPRMKALGWHAQFWMPCEQFVAEAPRLLAHGIPLVIDHMGRFDAARGPQDPAFRRLTSLVADGGVWVKLTPARNSRSFPDYPDVRPFHDALLRANPERLVWGSDWPYLRLGEATPEASHLLGLLDEWTGDESLRHAILVTNPCRLYGVAPPPGRPVMKPE